ncbi:MAG: hypothetical protein H6631_01125 [Anaerolineaceae bacterium]|nr:hypothetical protein [Anaerolineaceae bacterium]MCB9098098.1 hypothetical protein [Anaerolineales bacterium]
MTHKLKVIIAISTFLIVPLLAYLYLFTQKKQQYKVIEQAQKDIIKAHQNEIQLKTFNTEVLPQLVEGAVTIPNFLPEPLFAELHDIVLREAKTERTYLPGHKKGGTISYEELHHLAPKIVALYHSPEIRQLISQIVGEPVNPTPINDQSSCSLLYYDKPGDHIGWHYDHNFYNGRHFTVLLPIINEHLATKELSSTRLMVKKNGSEEMVPTPPNTLVIFEGARTIHKVTPLEANELRILVSMTFSTTGQASIPKEVARRFKDTAFFGLRALWT